MAIKALLKSWFGKSQPKAEPTKYQQEQLAKEAKAKVISPTVGPVANKAPIEVKTKAVATGQSLSDMVFNSTQLSISLIALAKIEDQAILADIIIKHSIAKIRQEAAKKMSQLDLITTTANKIKHSDKGTYRILRTKLDTASTTAKAQEKQNQKLTKICADLEALNRNSNNPLFAAKVQSLQQQWQQLEQQATLPAELTQRYQSASNALAHIVQEHKKQELAEATAKQEQTEVFTELTALVNELITLESITSIDELKQKISSIEDKWQRSTQVLAATVNETLLKQINALQQQLKTLLPLIEFLATDHAELHALVQQLTESPDNKAAYSELKDLVKPLALHKYSQLPKALLASQTALAQAEQLGAAQQSTQLVEEQPKAKSVKPQQAEFSDLIQKIEQSLNEGHSREASQYLRAAQQLAKTHHLYEPRLGQWAQELQQLKDWAGFAIIPKKEALVAQMAALAAQDDSDGLDRLERIKELQAEWQDVGMVNNDAEKALWQQFKELSQQAYQPCQRYFDEQKNVQEQNAVNRQALCVELQQYLDSMPSDVNWQGHVAILKKAREDWQKHHPVEAKTHKKLQPIFTNIIKALEDKLHAEYYKQELLKQAIIAEAEQLLALEDNRVACQKAKDLQQQWKTISSCGHAKDQALWEVFRRHCDAVFNKREQIKLSRQEQEALDIETANALKAELQALANEKWNPDIQQSFDVLGQRFQLLAVPRDLYQELRALFTIVRQKWQQELQVVTATAKEQQMLHVTTALELCAQAESLLATGASLSDNLVDAWAALTLPPFFDSVLKKRWQHITTVTPSANSDFNDSCLLLELLLEIDSPKSEKAARTAKKMQLFQQQSYPKSAEEKLGMLLQHMAIVLSSGGLADPESANARLALILQHPDIIRLI